MWHQPPWANPQTILFQSTHPWRVWRSLQISGIMQSVFQSTHPWRVWLYITISSLTTPEFQSTHPWRVWRLTILRSRIARYFNPHTREGCDWSGRYPRRPISISIHTPVKGVTNRRDRGPYSAAFQSTHPWRVWLIHHLFLPLVDISIHTPVKGVTHTTTSLKGSLQFQSTHPWRVWHGIP